MIESIASCALALASAVISPGEWNDAIDESQPLNWYRLDESFGTTAIDYGSESRNGTYGGGGASAPTLGASGRVGGAVTFDGSARNILLNAPPLAGDWTAEFLLMKTGTKVSAELIRGAPFKSPSSHLKLEQYPNTGQVGFTQSFVADRVFSPAVVAPIGEFVHLALVKDSGGIKAFLNGALAGSSGSSVPLYRYQFGDTVSESPIAVVDEIIIYDRALTATEVARHFHSIPEPSSLALAGFALLLLSRRAKRSNARLP